MRLKIGVTIVILAGLSFVAVSKEQDNAEKPYDLVLNEDRITFHNSEELMQRHVPLLVRDLGVRELHRQGFKAALTLILDGKEYEFKIRGGMAGSGRDRIIPKTSWATVVNLGRYDVAKTALSAGKHTIAVRDNFVKSNTLTIFITKIPDNKELKATR